MDRPRKPTLWISLVLLSTLGLTSGCFEDVLREDDIRVAEPNRLDRLVYGDYWKMDKGQQFPARGSLKRIAVAAFEVELVMERILKVPDNRGNSTRKMVYGDHVKEEIADRLHKLLVERWKHRNLEVVPVSDVVGAQAYSGYQLRDPDLPFSIRHDQPIIGSAGAIRVTELRPASRLGVVVGPEDPASVDQALARELDALVLRMRFRVGVIKGCCTVERGSVVHLSTGETTARMESLRTLRSQHTVTNDFHSLPGPSGRFSLDSDEFLSKIDTVFLDYAALSVTDLMPKE